MTPSRPTAPLFFALTFALLPTAKSDPIGTPILWRNLTHVQSAVGVSNYVWDGDALYLSNGTHHIRFFAGRRKSDIDGTAVWLNAAPDGSVQAGDWRMASTDLDLLLLSVLPTAEGETKQLRVMLDPGHGGEDDGASGAEPAVKEKDLALAVALQIGARLTRAGLSVSYTRTNDVSLALDERSRLTRKARADLFISVHANYASNADASGVETYVLPLGGYPGTAEGSGVRGRQVGNRNDFHNTLLGYAVHRNLTRLDESPDRGLKRQSYYVLRETSCPAVLLEIGFLSNPAEVRRMLGEAWQSACSAAVADGVLSYARKVDNLDRALSEKRMRDAEANERWRQHLAALDARKAAANSSNRAEAAIASLPQPTASPAAPSSASTNTAPLELNTLIEFYATGRTE